MKKIKKSVMIPVVAALAAGVFAGARYLPEITTAYFTDNDQAENEFTVGENEIEIVETFTPPEQPVVGDNTFTKSVEIKNTGDVPCYIRAFIEFSDNDVRGESKVSPDGTNYYTMAEFNNHLPSGWVYVDSGAMAPYYYYTGVVDVNASTPKLLQSVKTTFAKESDIEPYEIYVYAESVQTLDKDGKEFTGTDPWRQAWTEYLGS